MEVNRPRPPCHFLYQGHKCSLVHDTRVEHGSGNVATRRANGPAFADFGRQIDNERHLAGKFAGQGAAADEQAGCHFVAAVLPADDAGHAHTAPAPCIPPFARVAFTGGIGLWPGVAT